MKLTTFFKLKKPEGVDTVNVDDFNDNFDTIDAALNEAASKSGDMSEGLVFATTASSRIALNSGDSLATILSKLMKWLSDLKTGAFNTVANNDTTTAAGYVADARVVAEHGTEIDGIDTRVSALETSFPAGCDTIYQGSVTAGVTPTAKTPSALAAAYTAVKNFWIHNDRVGSAAAADVRNGRTFTNDSAVGQEGTMPDLTASNFTGAHSATAAGAASNYTVKASKAGYVPNGTTVNSLAAATSPTIATTAETGTKVINIKPGYYNKISVNQTYAYNAGKSAAVTTQTGSFSMGHWYYDCTFTLNAGNFDSVSVTSTLVPSGSIDAGDMYVQCGSTRKDFTAANQTQTITGCKGKAIVIGCKAWHGKDSYHDFRGTYTLSV